jgi:adenosylmethionine-8-amino-7-oxononanoate aminotransferase
MGRTGRFLCAEHWSLEPDIVTLSKSLGGGYIPVSATITRRSIHDATFSRLERCQVHSKTFGPCAKQSSGTGPTAMHGSR